MTKSSRSQGRIKIYLLAVTAAVLFWLARRLSRVLFMSRQILPLSLCPGWSVSCGCGCSSVS